MGNQNKIPFTKEGYEKIKKEYGQLFSSRKEAVETLSRAREMGDLSENGFYKAAKQRLSSIDYNLRRLKFLIKQAEVVVSQNNSLGIGSKVKVGGNGSIHFFKIVGKYEANPSEGKISDISPIGKALIGKKAGDEVRISTPKGEVIYKIIKIK